MGKRIDFILRDHHGLAIAGGAGFKNKRRALRSARCYCRDMLPESSIVVLTIDAVVELYHVTADGEMERIK